MDVLLCVCVYSICVVLCLDSGVATGWSLIQGVLPSVKKWLRNWIRGLVPEWARRVIVKKKYSTGTGFPWVFRFLLPILIPPTAPQSSPGAGTIGKLVAEVLSGLSLTPPQETWRKTALIPDLPGGIEENHKKYHDRLYILAGIRCRDSRIRSISGVQSTGN
jgi:hypothetical protein